MNKFELKNFEGKTITLEEFILVIDKNGHKVFYTFDVEIDDTLGKKLWRLTQ